MINLRLYDVARAFFGLGIFFILIMLYTREISWLNNTDRLGILILKTAAVIVSLGQVAIWIIYTERIKKDLTFVQIHIAVFMVCLLISPLCGSLYNRLGCDQTDASENAILIDIKAYSTSIFGMPEGIEFENEGFHLEVETSNGLKTYKMKKNLFPNSEPGETILIPKKQGCWGFSYFYE